MSTRQHRTGGVVEWDRATLANRIEADGCVLRNVPVVDAPESHTFRQGDVVALLDTVDGPVVLGRVLAL